MRKALVIGIDHYDYFGALSGCVRDAHAIANTLERHADGTVNFVTPKLLTRDSVAQAITRKVLRESVTELFDRDSEIALLYFAGHGHLDATGGFICGGECTTGDEGLSLHEVMAIADRSAAKNKVIILDCCHSGSAGARAGQSAVSEVKEGMTILTASTATQYALETAGGGAGVFTSLLLDALEGAACNLLGDVTPGGIYAHIDQSLGPWAQRPVFKTNVRSFVSLRRAAPPIPIEHLRTLAKHFPTPDFDFRLDPAFEPERSKEQLEDPEFPRPDPAKNATFAVLQAFVRVNLVRPYDAPHMWHAAMESKSCRLTVLGQHYRDLVEKKLI
jgi:hypothetical protein